MTTATDILTDREQAFAAWLARAILLALPIDAVPVRRDDLIHLVAISADVPLSLTTGDVMRGIMRAVKAGEIEWCGEDVGSLRRRAPATPTLDASRLRTLAAKGEQRLVRYVLGYRARLAGMAQTDGADAEAMAVVAGDAALAERELRGYRAAVADLLGAVL